MKKFIMVKVASNLVRDACEDAGISYPHSGEILLWEDGNTTFKNGIPTNEAATKAAYQATGFKFSNNDHPSGLKCLGSLCDNSHIFESLNKTHGGRRPNSGRKPSTPKDPIDRKRAFYLRRSQVETGITGEQVREAVDLLLKQKEASP